MIALPVHYYKDGHGFYRVRDANKVLVAREFLEEDAIQLTSIINEHAAQQARIAALEAALKGLVDCPAIKGMSANIRDAARRRGVESEFVVARRALSGQDGG